MERELVGDQMKMGIKTPKIVIIGGGIAGITAADRLVRSGITDITILEASTRVGGRIWSINVDKAHNMALAELGANWIHGIDRNPIYTIADQNHLLELRNRNGGGFRNKHISVTENREVVPKQLVDEVDWDYGMLMQKCEEYFHNNMTTPYENDSVGAYMQREYAKKLEKFSDKEERHIREVLFCQRLCRETVQSGSNTMYDVSLSEIGSYEELPGVDYALPGGFESVINVLKQRIPEECIKLNSAVKCVQWNRGIVPKDSCVCEEVTSLVTECHIEKTSAFSIGYDSDDDLDDDHELITNGIDCYSSDPEHWELSGASCEESCDNEASLPVCITCENGQKYYADHVIVTVSLGCLKGNAQQLFDPTIPKQKLQAISNLGFGSVGKVILQFDENIVDSHIQTIDLLWDTWGTMNGECDDLRSTWFKKIYSFEVIAKNTLVGWISGRECQYMEKLPEDQIAADCVAILEKFLNRNDIPKPKTVVRTSWTKNPYTKGAYTYIPVGATVSDIEALADPVYGSAAKPQLLFAGEATHRSFYSTTHGALLTGRREADRLLSLYNIGTNGLSKGEF